MSRIGSAFSWIFEGFLKFIPYMPFKTASELTDLVCDPMNMTACTYIPNSSNVLTENSGLLTSPWRSLSFTSTSY